MKLRANRLFKRLLGNKGYTIDQTILIVVIIAILITLIIVTVGWTLINRSSGTRLGAQLKQMEDANGQFYAAHKLWPYQARNGNTAVSAAVQPLILAGSTNAAAFNANFGDKATSIDAADITNLIPGFRISGAQMFHSSNANQTITQDTNLVNGEMRIVIQFSNAKLSDVAEADKSIDNNDGAAAGRIQYRTTAGNCLGAHDAAFGGGVALTTSPSEVNVCYVGNSV